MHSEKLKEDVDYMLFYPPSMSSAGFLRGNGHRIPSEWVKAGDKIVDVRTCERKNVYCPAEKKNRVISEIIEPSKQAARNYNPPIWE